MAKINQIRVSYGKTFNMGNYESFRYDVELSSAVDDQDDLDSVIDKLRRQAKIKVNQAIRAERQKESWEEIF